MAIADPPADSHISHTDALTYWNTQEASVTGMLGGLPQVSRTDIQGSKNFFAKLRRRSALGKRRRGSEDAADADTATSSRSTETKDQRTSAETPQKSADASPDPKEDNEDKTHNFALTSAADCGAGIGRITLNFLSTIAHTIDIIEPVPKFTAEIRSSPSFAPLRSANRIGAIYECGLESWTPAKGTYDLIWNQWCLGQLTDAEAVAYLARAGAGLADGGVVVVKENVAGGDRDEYDAQDSSVTRCLGSWRRVFEEAGLGVVMEEVQRGFPRGLFAVRMWALRPVGEGGEDGR